MTKLILLVGIPGSGKTTYAKELIKQMPNIVHLSSDAIRKELYGDESMQKNPRIIFEIMHERTINKCVKKYSHPTMDEGINYIKKVKN